MEHYPMQNLRQPVNPFESYRESWNYLEYCKTRLTRKLKVKVQSLKNTTYLKHFSFL